MNCIKFINKNKILDDTIKKLLILKNCNQKLNPIINNKIKLISLVNFIIIIDQKLNFNDINQKISNNIYKFLDDYIIDILSFHNIIPKIVKNHYYNNIRIPRLKKWRDNLKIGDYCDAIDEESSITATGYNARWFEAKIIKIRKDEVEVKYLGWKDRYNRRIDKNDTKSILPHMTVKSNWRQNLRKNSYVEIQTSTEVFLNDFAKNYTKWNKAIVLHVERSIKYYNQEILENKIKTIICQLENGTLKIFTNLYDPTLVEFGTHNWLK